MNGYVTALEELALMNSSFREDLSTGEHARRVVISLRAREELGEATHAEVGQVFRIEQGRARLFFGDGGRRLRHRESRPGGAARGGCHS